MTKILNFNKYEQTDKIILFFVENSDEIRYVTAQYLKEELLIKFFSYSKQRKKYDNNAYLFPDEQTELLLKLFNTDRSGLLYKLKEKFNQFSANTDLVKFARDNGIGCIHFEDEFDIDLEYKFGNVYVDEPVLYYVDGHFIIHDFYEHPKDGIIKIYTPEGFLYWEFTYKNNMKNGTSKGYYKNTKIICSIENYTNDKLDGIQKTYFENGKLKKEETFVKGVKKGIEREYSENDYLCNEIMFAKNVRNGVAKEFYPNGNLKRETVFKDDLQDGDSKWYYETGELEGKSYWKNGKCHGDKFSYYKNGNIKVRAKYKNGKYYDHKIHYYENGQIEWDISAKNGKNEGDTYQYYENGKIKQFEQWHNGLKEGVLKGYYKSGKLKFENYYKKGGKHGICKTFHHSGKIRTITEYKNGKLHGKKQRFYNNGNLSYEQNYKNGLRHGFSVDYSEKTQEIKLKMYFRNGELIDWNGVDGIIGVKNVNSEEMLYYGSKDIIN